MGNIVNKRKNRMENDAKDQIIKEDTEQSTQRYEVKHNPSQTVQLHPTRYGDWEKNGRCIDF